MIDYDAIRARLEALPGDIGFAFQYLDGSDSFQFNAYKPMEAASVIKLPIMAACFAEMRAGRLDANEIFTISQADKMPSCGALTYMHDGLEVTLMDLITLMIIVSDNSATNMLIKRVGMECVNRHIAELQLSEGTHLNRLLFDSAASARGIQNYVTAGDMAQLLLRIYTLAEAGDADCAKMLQILGDQQLNGKIPFFLDSRGIAVAHKTGEDDGITHDVGIVFAKKPFIMCFLSNNTKVPAAERTIQDLALMLSEM